MRRKIKCIFDCTATISFFCWEL